MFPPFKHPRLTCSTVLRTAKQLNCLQKQARNDAYSTSVRNQKKTTQKSTRNVQTKRRCCVISMHTNIGMFPLKGALFVSTLFANTVYEHTVCATSVFRTGVLGKKQQKKTKKKTLGTFASRTACLTCSP